MSIFSPPMLTRLARDADALRGRVLRVVGEARVGDLVRKATTGARPLVLDCLEALDVWSEDREDAVRRSLSAAARERAGNNAGSVSSSVRVERATPRSDAQLSRHDTVPAALVGPGGGGGGSDPTSGFASMASAYTLAADRGAALAVGERIEPPPTLTPNYLALSAIVLPLGDYDYRRDLRRLVSQEREVARALLAGDYHGQGAARVRAIARAQADVLAAASGDWISVRVPIIACSQDLEAEILALQQLVFPRLSERFKTRRCRSCVVAHQAWDLGFGFCCFFGFLGGRGGGFWFLLFFFFFPAPI
jgi:hypothetical protein